MLRQNFGQPGGAFSAMHFNIDAGVTQKNHFDRLAFRLEWNRYNNSKIIQIVVKEV